jgi:proline iminopeptidase
VQKALSSPGFPASEAEMRATAERRTDRASFDAGGLARQSAALIAAPPRNTLLRRVRCPTLVLHGADDPVIPAAAAKDTADSIPGAELVIVPGMGHDFATALVPVYLRHIGDFVSKVETETAAAR